MQACLPTSALRLADACSCTLAHGVCLLAGATAPLASWLALS